MEALPLLNEYGILPKGIIHVGANDGREFEAYRAWNPEIAVYIEPISSVYAKLKAKVEQEKNHIAVRALCSSSCGELINFKIASNAGESSSIFDLGNHGILYPFISYVDHEQIVTSTLDSIIAKDFSSNKFNFLAIDVQGAELLVLKGATETLKMIDAVYLEVSELPIYEGGCTWREIDSFLSPFGFSLKFMNLTPRMWGNALYIKNSSFFSPLRVNAIERPGVNVALNKPATQSSLSQHSRPNDAQGAVNGVINGRFGFHTGFEMRPWWQVDLGEVVPIEEVLIFNRCDQCSARAYSFILKIATEPGAFEEVYAQGGKAFGGAIGHPARIHLHGTAARYIRVELPEEGALHLDEVEVYASQSPAASAKQS